jgi:glycosyltransferase involved in cell wall biosynthesis
MKIMVAHNAYQHKGGEDSVMESEVALLKNYGHSVEIFTRRNDDIEKMSITRVAIQAVWSSPVAQDFEARLRAFQPEVIHVHNTFPLISPSIYWVANRLNIPVIQTLHNFRLLCPQAMFLRNAKVCEDCLGKVPWRGAMRGCYRESVPQSTLLASMITLHRAMGTWQNKVTRYIALNDFCRNKFIQGGLPADRISIKPNFVDFDAPPEGPRNGFLFVGRLSTEKGVKVLCQALPSLDTVSVRIAGTGPEAGILEGINGLVALGALDMDQVRKEMVNATALVLPSIWYENFPRALVEAYGCGLPIIASRIGALSNLVEDGVTGLLFEPGNAKDLAEKMRWAHQNPQLMADMGRQARVKYETHFTAKRNYSQLLSIYSSAIAATQSRLA